MNLSEIQRDSKHETAQTQPEGGGLRLCKCRRSPATAVTNPLCFPICRWFNTNTNTTTKFSAAENLENYLPKRRPVMAGLAGPPKILKTIFPSALTWAGLAGLAGDAIYSCKIDHLCIFKE